MWFISRSAHCDIQLRPLGRLPPESHLSDRQAPDMMTPSVLPRPVRPVRLEPIGVEFEETLSIT
jgi:hypothetical protein